MKYIIEQLCADDGSRSGLYYHSVQDIQRGLFNWGSNPNNAFIFYEYEIAKKQCIRIDTWYKNGTGNTNDFCTVVSLKDGVFLEIEDRPTKEDPAAAYDRAMRGI